MKLSIRGLATLVLALAIVVVALLPSRHAVGASAPGALPAAGTLGVTPALGFPFPTISGLPPTPTPFSLPGAATATPVPHNTPVPTLAPTRVPTPVPTTAPLPTATRLPVPTATKLPVPTATKLPNPTATPLPVATATRVLAPTPTSTPPGTSSCPSTQSGCIQAMLNMLNADRAQYNVSPLTLNMTETNGTSSCVGSYGHSVHMAQVGQISHDQFPADICVPYNVAGENVGEANYGNELTDLQQMDSMMMAENSPPKAPGCTGSHACNIINPAFAQVGIGIYHDSHGTTWLTEDFTN